MGIIVDYCSNQVRKSTQNHWQVQKSKYPLDPCPFQTRRKSPPHTRITAPSSAAIAGTNHSLILRGFAALDVVALGTPPDLVVEPVPVPEADPDALVVLVVVAVELAALVLVVDVSPNPFAIVLNVLQDEDEGMGCAAGVAGWPWKNVEPPYTPIGCPESPRHCSNTPGL